MRTSPRVLGLCLLGLASAMSACGGQTASSVPEQRAPGAGSMHVQCRTLDFAKDTSANQLNGIDNRGEIAGSGTPAGGYVIRPPYRQPDFRMENYPGTAATTSVTGANDARTIVGFYRDGDGETEGFIYKHGVWTGVASKHSNLLEFLGISEGIVGFYADQHGVDHAFEDAPSRRIEPPGGISDVAAGINKSGHIVGYMTTVNAAVEGFLFEGGAYSEFLYPRSTNTAAFGINGRDEVAGSYVDSAGATHGFFLRSPRANPEWQSFDDPKASGFTRVSGINDAGEFVGSYRDAAGVMHGFYCR